MTLIHEGKPGSVKKENRWDNYKIQVNIEFSNMNMRLINMPSNDGSRSHMLAISCSCDLVVMTTDSQKCIPGFNILLKHHLNDVGLNYWQNITWAMLDSKQNP